MNEEVTTPVTYNAQAIRLQLEFIPDEFIIEAYRQRMLHRPLQGVIAINNSQASFEIKNLTWPNGKFSVEIQFKEEITNDAKTQGDNQANV